MEILVVTGGIGSGKSEVCRILSDVFSCGVYNADSRVKLLYDVHPTLLSDIEKLTGESLRDDEGRFVPSRLSARIFTDRSLLKQVEGMVFPALMEDFEAWSKAYSEDTFVVFESATILEKQELKGFGDKVILVDAQMQTRLERACRRDAASKESISSRMQNQKLMNSISAGETEPEVDAVIHNVGTLEDLKDSTIRVVKDLFDNL
jgi:dephospho-CoA kinase